MACDDNRFRRVIFHVEDGDVETCDMVITFANGDMFRPDIRHRFREGHARGRSICRMTRA